MTALQELLMKVYQQNKMPQARRALGKRVELRKAGSSGNNAYTEAGVAPRIGSMGSAPLGPALAQATGQKNIPKSMLEMLLDPPHDVGGSIFDFRPTQFR